MRGREETRRGEGGEGGEKEGRRRGEGGEKEEKEGKEGGKKNKSFVRTERKGFFLKKM
jgi:hypothetical protein